VRERDGATAPSQTNVEGAELGLFVDPSALDFHLAPSASAAIDQGTALDDAGDDIDGEARDQGPPDIGADEFTE
jgi:hypothetical protein